MRLSWCFFLPILFLGLKSIEGGQIEIGPEDDWFSLLQGDGLKPGDVVVLQEGSYTDARKLTMRHRGTEEAPVVIRGQEGGRVVFRRPDAKQNTINLEGASHLIIEGIEITGGSSGIRISDPVSGLVEKITLCNLHIHRIGGVGVTCNHPDHTYNQMHFHDNHIHHTGGHGEGFYLGANNDRDGKTVAVFCNSIVERNYIHHLNGENISQGDGIEIKDGSFGNTIRNNVIHDTKYPGITVYGTDGNEKNLIENNTIWNTGDHGIQVASEARVVGNTIFDTGGDGIRSQNHQSARVGDLEIRGNFIIKEKGIGIRVEIEKDTIGKVLIEENRITAGQPFHAPANGLIIARENAIFGFGEVFKMRSKIKRNAISFLGH